MTSLTPLRFEPLFKSMLWGGRRLPGLLRQSVATADPIGEAWLLSDVEGNVSRVASGPWRGQTLREVIAHSSSELFGEQAPADGRFPLLLKLIDARQELSVQVHPNDEQARQLKGPHARGKTEAWVILDADPATSRIYAGFQPGMTAARFQEARQQRTTPQTLHTFTPKPGDCVFLEAGTVHAIGANILLFEVQQTSDITYRLYDWDRVDAKTGQPRELHIEPGMICSNFQRGPCDPVQPVQQGERESLVECPYFTLHHRRVQQPTRVGRPGHCTAVVCVQGSGTLAGEPIQFGDAVLLPAVAGVAEVVPHEPLRLLECGLGTR